VPRDDDQFQNQGKERTIVVGIDGSEHSRLALKWASDEAERRDSILRIVYAQISDPKNVPGWFQPGSSDLSPGQAIVDDAYGLVATSHPSVVARAEVVDWPPSLVLTSTSRSADLLVVGARGRGGFEELLLGSVSDQCIQYSHCPVAVVHAAPEVPAPRAVQPGIVVGVDGSLESTRALWWALEEATVRSASVKAIFAWQYPPIGTFVLGPPQGYEMAAREIIEAATEYAEKWAPEVPIEVVDRFEAPVPALLDASQGADLLVTGPRGHGGFNDVLLGSVAHQCARHAKCVVVIARPSVAQEHASEAPLTNPSVKRSAGLGRTE
jgi:nucleotide-binding universal stress UspA family protein